MDDLDLIDEHKSCCQDAFNELHRRYEKYVYRVLWEGGAGSLSRQDIEELNQDVWFRVFRIKTSIRPPDTNVAGWLWRLSQNIVHDRLRRLGSELRTEGLFHETDFSDEENPSSRAEPEISKFAARLENKNLVQQLLLPLNPRERIAILLVHGGGYPYQEVARLLDVSINTVKSWLARGIKKIREGAEKNNIN